MHVYIEHDSNGEAFDIERSNGEERIYLIDMHSNSDVFESLEEDEGFDDR